VPRDERELGVEKLAVHDVQVGPADGAGVHAEEELTVFRSGGGELREPERLARCIEDHGAHQEYHTWRG
jgi:hypothetical protein